MQSFDIRELTDLINYNVKGHDGLYCGWVRGDELRGLGGEGGAGGPGHQLQPTNSSPRQNMEYQPQE